MEHLIITHNVKIATIALYVFLFTLMSIFKVMQFMGKNVENWLIRTRSFIFITVIFTVGLMSNVLGAFLVITLLSYLALKEFFSFTPTRKTDRRVLLWAYCAIPIQFYIIYIHWATLFYLFIPLYVFLLISMRMVMVGNTEGFLKSLATIQYGLMTSVYALGYLALILVIPFKYNPIGGSVGLLFFILIVTVANDFTQMACGKAFGKHKIIPKVSPNKTWEGFIGGVIGTTVLTVLIAPLLTPFSHLESAFAGFVLAIAGFFGDVTMSAVKRDMGIKDTSSLIPGHGGVLDRFDSLIFTAPLFFHYFAYINTIVITKGG